MGEFVQCSKNGGSDMQCVSYDLTQKKMDAH